MTPEDLIQAIRHLSSSGMPPLKIGEFYEALKPSMNGNFTEDHHKEIVRLISSVENKEKNIAQEVYEWVTLQDGIMSVAKCYSDLGYVNKQDKTTARVAFHRLIDKVIEKHGDQSGTYRKIEIDDTEQRWWEAKGKALKLGFPLDITQPKLFPGSLILLEGSKSQGKTRFALDFARLNKELFKDRINYLNVEMNDDEINSRIQAYENDKMWTSSNFRDRVKIIKVTSNWWDYINPDGLNIIDYIVEYEKTYLIAQYIFKIHDKMKNGLSLVIVQRDPKKDYGSGGYAIRNIPRLIISLKNHVVKLEDVKSFWMNSPNDHNPSGLMKKYKMPGLWKMVGQGDWDKTINDTSDRFDKKYEDFEGFEHEE
jgi:hypothetical protein